MKIDTVDARFCAFVWNGNNNIIHHLKDLEDRLRKNHDFGLPNSLSRLVMLKFQLFFGLLSDE
jgi:hypothetical protein